MKRYLLLLASFCLVFILPFVGSYYKWGGEPPGYGLFPAQEVDGLPGFNLTYFIVCCFVAFGILLFLFFPSIFGFKKNIESSFQNPVSVTTFPKWFYPGLIVTLVSWFFMWGRFEIVEPIDHYTFVPLWWGFILVLDGIVYKRTGGDSLIANRPNTMKLMAIASSFSWFVFEYQNFFVLGNWYYPNNEIFSNFGNISWQLASYTTVLPAVFEWYFLLKTFKTIRNKYANGPKISIPIAGQYILLIIGFIFLVLMGYYPYELFWMLWVSLIPAIVPAMSIGKYWTPFTEIATKGNYTPIVLIALATLVNGFFWEFWNFGSEWFHDYIPTNPNYWKYSVPYLDKYHIFSEMPLLGYFGYMFFGIVCWILWLAIAYLLKFDSRISIKKQP